MAVVPNVDTLAQIAGVGGWAGMYHGLSLYLEDTPLTPVKMAKIALLPLFWGSLGITGFMIAWLSLQSSLFVVGNMLRPFPFVLHMMTLSAIFLTYMARQSIRDNFFMTMAESAVAEQAQDRAEQVTQGASTADQAPEERSDVDNDEEEEEDVVEEHSDADEEHSDADEEHADDDASTVTDEAHEQNEEPQHTEETVSTLVAEVDRLMSTAGPDLGAGAGAPQASTNASPASAEE